MKLGDKGGICKHWQNTLPSPSLLLPPGCAKAWAKARAKHASFSTCLVLTGVLPFPPRKSLKRRHALVSLCPSRNSACATKLPPAMSSSLYDLSCVLVRRQPLVVTSKQHDRRAFPPFTSYRAPVSVRPVPAAFAALYSNMNRKDVPPLRALLDCHLLVHRRQRLLPPSPPP
eukprot:TRINITY_DN17070_c0_g2_i1.p1 TRINITY_DN17070_c0_g2~~TRINITY_DN17070_c0_g2_i1.p1  ORF type:complete len:172 (+),score=24.60 TRINITY_DN17070_c0_g2_i1:282-797(+)